MKKPRFLKPLDALSVIFLGLLLAVTLIMSGRIPGAYVLALRYLGVMAIVITASIAARKYPLNNLFKYIDVLMPIFAVLFTFDSMGQLTGFINPPDKDPLLALLDLSLFGVHPGVFMERIINPTLTSVLQLSYTSYYFLPIALCLILYFRGDTDAFERSVFGIVLGFFVSYIGYMLVPALGPRFFIKDAFHADLMRGPLASAINDTLNILEGENRDAFPSGHTEVVLIVLIYAWQYRRWYFWVGLPLVLGLIFSTVYLRYHYAVDVIAGIVLAPLCVLAASWLYRLLKGGKPA
jgi:membrane-associated phospholipid phosphatase